MEECQTCDNGSLWLKDWPHEIYIVLSFHSSFNPFVCSFFHSFILPSHSWTLHYSFSCGYIFLNTHQKVFMFGPWVSWVCFPSISSGPRVHAPEWGLRLTTRTPEKCYIAFYTPPHKKFECSKILSVPPSISASFPDSNLSSFWPIFFKLCMDIDIREEWFGIANGLISFINNRVMSTDWCKNVVSGL